MEDKLITIAMLPYSKAEILSSLLEAEGIECVIEKIDLIEGTTITGVKVCIRAGNLKKAFPLLNEVLGKVDKIAKGSENSILVPVDFSEFSYKAVLAAFEIARQLKSKLILYHIIAPPAYFTFPYSDLITYDSAAFLQIDTYESEARRKFQEFLSSLILEIGTENWNEVDWEYMLTMGDAEDDILSFCEKHPPRLIVMGTKGKHTIKEDLIGTTTADIIARANVPVLAIPEKMKKLNLHTLKKVVYATNFDEKDFIALDKLVLLLRPFNVKLYCLHVGCEKSREWDEAKLNGIKDLLLKKHLHINLECVCLQGNDILTNIEAYIKANKIDILSLTTHKRNMITRIFNPGIAREMLFHTQTPLLVFHA